MENKIAICGIVTIVKKFKNRETEIKIIKNRIMDNALDEMIKGFYSVWNTNMLLRHIAFGDDNTANTNTMTKLVNEIYRVPIIYKARSGTGAIICRAILKDTQPEDTAGIATIREIGLYAGTGSFDWLEGSGKDFGLLLSRVVLNPVEDKIASEEIQVTWEYQIERG
ncbi:MAG: hypothetical protein JXB50_07810 [Spirochaetes bacterium]|nr:hypothetical protein [Spirochaetota bacterium]